MAISGRHQLAIDLCAALGLDPSHAYGITLELAPNKPVSALVKVYLSAKQIEEITHLVREYKAQLMEIHDDLS